MKCFKKTVALLLMLAMSLSLVSGYTKADAATTLQVTLRVEQDNQTMVTPVTVTLTDDDKRDFGIGLPTDSLTPMHALAKYMETEKGATATTMSKYINYSISEYGGYLSGISVDGTFNASGNATTIPDDYGVYWMFTANNAAPIDSTTGYGYATDGYPLKNNDSIVFYGSWYSADVTSYYTTFDKTKYDASVTKPLTITLKGLAGTDYSGAPAKEAIEGATIIVSKYDSKTPAGATTGSAIAAYTTTTDKNGQATIPFTSAGLYTISAYKVAPDGVHQLLSRPYALVSVMGALGHIPVDFDNKVILIPKSEKLAKPTGLKAKITNKKKKKKTITISWKKVKKAKGYGIYISKKKKNGYKKVVDTNKLKVKIKRKKGTYYVKVRAFKKQNKKKIFGAYSKILTVKVNK